MTTFKFFTPNKNYAPYKYNQMVLDIICWCKILDFNPYNWQHDFTDNNIEKRIVVKEIERTDFGFNGIMYINYELYTKNSDGSIEMILHRFYINDRMFEQKLRSYQNMFLFTPSL